MLVRYSHELRPYALWLALAAWALDAADRWIERGGERFPVEFAVAATTAMLVHYFAVTLWFPVAAAWLEGRLDGRIRRRFGRMQLGLFLLSTAPIAAWLLALWRWGGTLPPGRRPQWSYEEIERRLEDLLLRGYEAQPTVDHALLLFAVLAGVGFAVVARRRGGSSVLAGLVGGTFVVELALLAAARFTHFRYDQFGLLFFELAMAAGIVAFANTVGRWNRASGIATATILATAVVATSVNGLIGYAQRGRHDWPAVARAIRALEGPEAPIATGHPFGEISLGYYLGRYDRYREPVRGFATFSNDRRKLEALLAADPAPCRLVLLSWHSRPPELVAGLEPARPILELPETDDAALYRFATPGAEARDCEPPSGFAVEPSPGYGHLFPWLRLAAPGAPSAAAGS
jgi:hypothetical protein